MNLSFFKRRTSSGLIRGAQVANYIGAKLNPIDGYENDICVFVKMRPRGVKNEYIDIIDNPRYIEYSKIRRDVGTIAISKIAHEYISFKTNRDDIVLIPQHHCNFDREKRIRKEITTVGYIGEKYSLQNYDEIEQKLAKVGLKLICKWHAPMEFNKSKISWKSNYKTREDVVNFYKNIDIQIVWRPIVDVNVEELKNPLKLSNAGSFGIPTVSWPEKSFVSEYDGCFIPAKTIDEAISYILELKNNQKLYDEYSKKGFERSENYHIENISKLYLNLLKKDEEIKQIIPVKIALKEEIISPVNIITSNNIDLSVVIPARNEEWLNKTIETVLKSSKANTEVIAILDGYWPEPGIKQHPKVTLIHHNEPIGQRAATNEGVKISRAKYVMKLDAHCSLEEGFDVKLMQDCKPDWTVIPRMYNFHVFDWKCKKCGNQTYMGPLPKMCLKCNSEEGFEKVVIWKPRRKRYSDFWRFDNTLHFQYWSDFKIRPEANKDIVEVMSSIGACFFMERKRFWEIEGLDEKHGSWGQFGVEIALKSTLSGGKHVVNKKTWFAHMFRTQDGFGFPYHNPSKAVDQARKYSRDLWRKNKWHKAIHPLSWYIEKFWPVLGWNEEDLKILKSEELVKL